MNGSAVLANAAWLTASMPEWIRYRRSASRLEQTQRDLLSRYLQVNADTEYGRMHRFAAMRSWEDYAQRVPPRSYDEYQPWVERIAAGSTGVLTAQPVVLLEPSSGSSGPEKWVPYTRALQAEFRRAVAVWISQNFMDAPGLMAGQGYWSLTPQVARTRREKTPVPIGFDEDSAYLGGIARRMIDLTLVTKPGLKDIGEADIFWRATILLMLRCRDLRLISVWHPSYLLLLLRYLRSNWDTLLNNLCTGLTLTTPPLSVACDRGRAAELQALGSPAPCEIWPRLTLISCWGDAHAARDVEAVKAAFPGVRVQPKGLVATEAFVTLPLGDSRPLAARSHFFEFADEAGQIHPAWRTRPGGVYTLIVTTGGGLYRYKLMDRVEVTDYYQDIPSLRFLGKEDNVSDHCGEKLSETFVASVLDSLLSQFGIASPFAMLALDFSGETPGYTLYLHSSGGDPGLLEERLEHELNLNPNYALCRRLGQLRSAQTRRVPARAHEIYTQRLTQSGLRLGNVKPSSLSRLSGWSECFSDADTP